MKKLNFIRAGIIMSLLVSFSFYPKAQTSLTFTQSMDSILAPLDKNRISTGILYDRVKPMANIDLFNTPSSDPFVAEYSLFCQAYFELYHATYNNNNWLKPAWFRAKMEGEVFENRYVVGLLDYLFNMIDSNAVNAGMLNFSNGQLYDVPGATNPYYTKRLQIATILTNELPSGMVTLQFNPEFFQTNQSQPVSNILLNFGSLGSYTLNASTPTQPINFSGTGIKEYSITVQYANGSSFTHAAEIQIGASTAPYANRVEGIGAELPDASFWISGKYPFQGYEESQLYYGKAKISIWWKRDANNNPVPGIKKPVIIVDGFDPLGDRLDTGIYKLFVYDTSIFVNGISVSQKLNFADELRNQGFDIIVMDLPGYKQNVPGTINDPSSSLPYPKALYDDLLPASVKGVIFGGGDYVQRNAYTLEALIDYCNQQMQINGSSEKQVIVGPSMGGQITRYALRDMELRGQNHNCRLWISFDSNHEGAYAPMGIQYSLDQLAAGSEEANILRDTYINSPIAKQTLIHHYLSNSETVKGAPGFYNRYYDEINNPAFGFP